MIGLVIVLEAAGKFVVVVGWGGVQSHNHVKPNSVEVVLRLSWGCDN